MRVVVGILSIFSFFLIISVSVPFLVCVILLILALFMLLLQENSAAFNLFCGVPIVVALDMNIYSSPGHKSSIGFFSWINNNTRNWMVWADILSLKHMSCSSICNAKWNIFICTTRFLACDFYRWNGDPYWFVFYP